IRIYTELPGYVPGRTVRVLAGRHQWAAPYLFTHDDDPGRDADSARTVPGYLAVLAQNIAVFHDASWPGTPVRAARPGFPGRSDRTPGCRHRRIFDSGCHCVSRCRQAYQCERRLICCSALSNDCVITVGWSSPIPD